MANQKSKNFKLEYSTRGASYSASIDYRRFTTLDYNLDSYVGIVGAGVISGWNIVSSGGLNVQILPGFGIIDGYAVESPYTYKQRVGMVMGEREIEEIHDIIDPVTKEPVVYPDLTGYERIYYISVIQAYDPTYVPPTDIENCFVKVVVPTELTLLNNADNYVYAIRSSGTLSYPMAADFPPTMAIRPVDSDYPNYTAYQAALNTYLAQVNTIHNYEWRANIANHYSAVDFQNSLTYYSATNRILLGKVSTAYGQVENIDVSKVSSLENMESAIKEASTKLISHVHGGTGYFDPPKIKLETDIRKAAILSYDESNKKTVYNVLEKDLSSLELGHKHTIYIDISGNGYTVDRIGETDEHYHTIAANVVSNQITSNYTVEDHTHDITIVDTVGGWTPESQFIVYFNDTVIGTETSSNIVANSNSKTLAISGLVGPSYRTYSMSVAVNTVASIETYTFVLSSFSVLNYMLSAMVDFNSRYGSAVNITNSDGTIDVSNNPFLFTNDENTAILSLQPLYDQSLIAQTLLKNIGDNFLFTPNAAKNITITVTNSNELVTDDYDVKIEILGNTEVSGILNTENVTYINAQKIQLGIFDVAKIPQISHIGRMRQEVLPFKYPLSSHNGVAYYVSPSLTTTSLDHYHGLAIDDIYSGITSQTFVNNEPVLYATGKTGISYFVDHIHGVTSSNVSTQSCDGLLSWQNDIHGSNSNSSSHTHTVIDFVNGNQKYVYSIKEAEDGTIYAGTSDGFMIVPNGDAYLYVVNGEPYYMIGSDLWELLLQAKRYYEKFTKQSISVDETKYLSQINEAYDFLSDDGDSYLLYGYIDPIRGQDKIMIKKLDYFNIPYFLSQDERSDTNLEKNEILVDQKFYNEDGDEVDPGAVTNADEVALGSAPISAVVQTTYVVNKLMNNTPIWSIELKDVANSTSEQIIAVGSDVLSSNYDLSSDFYKTWTTPDEPDFSGSIRKSFSDSLGDVWIISDGGITVSRSSQNLKVISTVTQPGKNTDVRDVIEGSVGEILVTCSDGIYKTIDSGLTWTRIFSELSGCTQLIRDYSEDITNTTLSHYHDFNVNVKGDGNLGTSIGSYTLHSHTVSSWNIGTTLSHTHTAIVTLYTVTGENEIYKSIDSGTTWTSIGFAPSEEHGDIFAKGSIYTSLSDGLYTLAPNNSWVKISSSPVYSFANGYLFDKVLLGGNNSISSTTDFVAFSNVITMEGSPQNALYLNDSIAPFDYYSNLDNSFRFKQMQYSQNQSFSLVDFNKWTIPGGGWDNSIPYDIYINELLVLSTKKDVDKREEYGYNFVVDNISGIIDFGATTDVTREIAIYDNSISVGDASKFKVGDKIYIKRIMEPLSIPSSSDNPSVSYIAFKDYVADRAKQEEMYWFSFISAISGNQIYFAEKFDRDFTLPTKIYRIPPVDKNTQITANIYESPLSNIGVFSHEELEDKMSKYHDGKPYDFNNAFLSNLLGLTQAMRYVYPDIDSKMNNSKFYDFHYSWLPNDPIYPYIGNYIDLYACDVNNFSIFTNQFFKKGAKKVNRIYIGKRTFADIIFVATDIGVFYAAIEDGLEGNWFFSSLEYSVEDIIQFGDNIMACTANGTYITDDLETWSLDTQAAIYFPSHVATFRWAGGNTKSVASHTALFDNIQYNYAANVYTGFSSNAGSIISTSNVYGDLLPNKKIEIVNAGNISGTYTIMDILSNNSFTTFETFPIGVPTTYSDVTMTEGAWWQYFDGDYNTQHPNITNTLIIGGKNAIAYCSNSISCTWKQSIFPSNLTDFKVETFGIINNGSVLASTVSTKEIGVSNYLLECDNEAKNWNVFHEFDEVKGRVMSWSKTSFSHTKINVSYFRPNPNIYMDGNICKYAIAIYTTNSDGYVNTNIYNGDIIWNENIDGSDYIYVFGLDLNTLLNSYSNTPFGFIIKPVKINSILHASDNTILYGTDNGIYSDEKTKLTNYYVAGQVTEIGYGGIVNQIDIVGNILSASQNVTNGKTNFNVNVGENIAANSLEGYSLYITDFSPVVKMNIVKNSGVLANGEMTIETDKTFSSFYSTFSSKSIVINNNKTSKVYVTFNASVSYNQFMGGVVSVVSNEYDNVGKSYSITGNTGEYIIISPSITPSNSTQDLLIGQKVSMVDSQGRLTLFVSYDNQPQRNQLVGMSVAISDTNDSAASSITNITVYSNDVNELVLNTFTPPSGTTIPSCFTIGDRFSLHGFSFAPLVSFNNKVSSISSNHYHDVNVIGSVVTGEIASFSNISSSYVDISVTNTVGFNTPLMLTSGDLLQDADIVLINPNDPNQWIRTQVVSTTSSSVRVKTKDDTLWNFYDYDQFKVSMGWDWSINSQYYGYTENTYYEDFASNKVYVTSDLLSGNSVAYVTSTSGMLSNDRVSIMDETLNKEINEIFAIVNSTTIILKNTLTQSYYKKDNPTVEVLSSTFGNNHVHQIRDCQVETLEISEYLDLGYPANHSHKTQSLLTTVSKMIERNGAIYAIGSSENIYSSYNISDHWDVLVDLNGFLEHDDVISGVIDITIDNNDKLVVGTDNGYIATEEYGGTVVPLEKPTV